MAWAAYQQLLAQLARQYLARSQVAGGKVLQGLQGVQENAKSLTAALGGVSPGTQGQQGETARVLLQLLRRQMAQFQAPPRSTQLESSQQQAQHESQKAQQSRLQTRQRAQQAKELQRQTEELVKKSAKLALVFGGMPAALMGFTAAVIKAGRAAREYAHALARYSPEMAAVDAANWVREIRRMQQSGRATAFTTGLASEAWQDLQDTLRPIRDWFANLKNMMVAGLLQGLRQTLFSLAKTVAAVVPFGAKILQQLDQMNKNLEKLGQDRAALGRDLLADILQGNFGGQIVKHPIIEPPPAKKGEAP